MRGGLEIIPTRYESSLAESFCTERMDLLEYFFMCFPVHFLWSMNKVLWKIVHLCPSIESTLSSLGTIELKIPSYVFYRDYDVLYSRMNKHAIKINRR